MKGMDRHTICIRSDHTSQSISHIAGSIVREGETEDIGWEVVGLCEDICYPGSEDLCLTTSWSGDHEHWPIYSLYGFTLARIEGCEDVGDAWHWSIF